MQKQSPKRHRASLVLIRDGSILLVHRKNQKQGEYYIFPGGGIKPGETPEGTVMRETLEESGLEVEVERILFDHVNDFDHNTLVLCREIGSKEPVWQETYKQTESESYAFEWITLSALPSTRLLPLEGRDVVIEYFAS